MDNLDTGFEYRKIGFKYRIDALEAKKHAKEHILTEHTDRLILLIENTHCYKHLTLDDMSVVATAYKNQIKTEENLLNLLIGEIKTLSTEIEDLKKSMEGETTNE